MRSSPGHNGTSSWATVKDRQYWFDCTFWLEQVTLQFFNKFSNNCTNLSIATAQRICDPTAEALGVHRRTLDHVVDVFWTSAVLVTTGNESVAMSVMLVVGQKVWATSWIS